MTELKGHSDRVIAATFSGDSRRIVTASADQTVKVWEANNGSLVATFKGNQGITGTEQCSSDGHRIVAASWEETRVWEAGTGHLPKMFKLPWDTNGILAFSPDCQRMLTASLEMVMMPGNVSLVARLWAVDTGRLVAELKGHQDTVERAAFSPDGRRIVTAALAKDKTARIWAADTGLLVAALDGHLERINSVMFSPDGRRIVTTREDKTARMWEVDTGHLVTEFTGHRSGVTSAAFSLNGRRVVTASTDGTVRVWEADTRRLVAECPGSKVSSAAFSRDGKRLVTVSNNIAQMCEVDTGRVVAEFKGHGDYISSTAFSPDGKRIVTASADRTARIWDAAPETRSAEQIAKLVHCYVPLRFDKEESGILVPTEPDPTACQDGPQTLSW